MLFTIYLLFIAIFAVLISQVTDTLSKESEDIILYSRDNKDNTEPQENSVEESVAEEAPTASVAQTSSAVGGVAASGTLGTAEDLNDDEINDFADEFLIDIEKGI